MKINQLGIDLIKQFEGCKLSPYKCSAGVATIGYGSTFYPNNIRVQMSDKPITKEYAEELLKSNLKVFEDGVSRYVKSKINSNQFSALVSFAFNLGVGNLAKSTLLKLVNKNPSDPAINLEFMKWNKANGKVLAGLTRRRQAESELYFK
jgi:lysozyme